MSAVRGIAASEYWRKYYAPADVAEILSSSTAMRIVSGTYPLHVRLYERGTAAPTVIVSHPMLPYGLMMAHLHLPFYRAGFNVVQWDLPGFGLSGGPRAACPVSDIIRGWRDVLAFAHARYDDPLYALALAEDGVTCYYALANDPRVRAMSFHCLHEYGDPDGLHWQGPHWLIRAQSTLATLALAVRPTLGIPARRAFPWEAIFSEPDDERLLRIFERDPLRVQSYKLPLAQSLARQRRPPVLFEDCVTPVQMIVSERSRMWPVAMQERYFNRLGGPKEWISLAEMDQWSFAREFQEMYANLVMRWYETNGATPPAGAGRQPGEPVPAATPDEEWP
jgi:alpha-beta hydrolase superfamily lysophospholipase